MFCTLSDCELGNYLLAKVMEFMKEEEPRKLAAVANIGFQDTISPVYVLSPDVCYNIYVCGYVCIFRHVGNCKVGLLPHADLVSITSLSFIN